MGKVRLPAISSYVVTGSGRSGTTYMMRCLEAGGLDVMNKSWRYELIRQDKGIDFQKLRGKAFKLFSHRLIKYDVSNCAILFMKRNPFDIIMSHFRLYSPVHPWIAACTVTEKGWKIDTSVYDKKRKMCANRWRKQARAYTECQIEEMDTYEKRLKFFTGLKAQGWPINPEAASKVENDEKERIRKRGRTVAWE